MHELPQDGREKIRNPHSLSYQWQKCAVYLQLIFVFSSFSTLCNFSLFSTHIPLRLTPCCSSERPGGCRTFSSLLPHILSIISSNQPSPSLSLVSHNCKPAVILLSIQEVMGRFVGFDLTSIPSVFLCHSFHVCSLMGLSKQALNRFPWP